MAQARLARLQKRHHVVVTTDIGAVPVAALGEPRSIASCQDELRAALDFLSRIFDGPDRRVQFSRDRKLCP